MNDEQLKIKSVWLHKEQNVTIAFIEGGFLIYFTRGSSGVLQPRCVLISAFLEQAKFIMQIN
jgi:hypothetical protein